MFLEKVKVFATCLVENFIDIDWHVLAFQYKKDMLSFFQVLSEEAL